LVDGPGSGRAAGATEAALRRRAPGAGGSPAAGTLRARGDDTPDSSNRAGAGPRAGIFCSVSYIPKATGWIRGWPAPVRAWLWRDPRVWLRSRR